jgi:hypothetical protein
MAGNAPPLVIPITMDGAAALAMLKKLEQAGKDGTGKIKEGADEATGSFGALTSSLLGVQSGLGLVQQFATAFGASLKDASEWITKVVDKYSALREMMRGLAALEGRMPSNEFTNEMIEETKQSKVLTTTEYAQAKKSFSQYGSLYVSPEDRPGTGRIERDQLKELLPQIAGYAKMRDLPVDLAMKGMSTIMQKMPKGTTNEKYMEEFTKILETSEFSRGSAEASMSQFVTVAAENVGKGLAFGEGSEGLDKAIVALGVEQEAHMGEAGSYLKDMIHGVQHLHKTGKAAELGIKYGDDPKTIALKVLAKWKASGKEDFGEFWLPYSGGHGGMNFEAAMKTLMNEGLGGVSGTEGTSFAMMEANQTTIGPGTFKSRYDKLVASDQGLASAQAQAQDIAEMERAKLYLEPAKMKKKAHEELTREGYWDTTDFAHLYRQTIGRVTSGGKSPEEQADEQRAIEDQLDKVFGKNRLSPGRLNWASDQIGSGKTTDQQLLDLAKMQADQLRKQTDLMEQDAKPPLSAPPPRPQTRP